MSKYSLPASRLIAATVAAGIIATGGAAAALAQEAPTDSVNDGTAVVAEQDGPTQPDPTIPPAPAEGTDAATANVPDILFGWEDENEVGPGSIFRGTDFLSNIDLSSPIPTGFDVELPEGWAVEGEGLGTSIVVGPNVSFDEYHEVMLHLTFADESTDTVRIGFYIDQGAPIELPVDPDLDSDGDGVSDADEIASGTDPEDPSSFALSDLYELALPNEGYVSVHLGQTVTTDTIFDINERVLPVEITASVDLDWIVVNADGTLTLTPAADLAEAAYPFEITVTFEDGSAEVLNGTATVTHAPAEDEEPAPAQSAPAQLANTGAGVLGLVAAGMTALATGVGIKRRR